MQPVEDISTLTPHQTPPSDVLVRDEQGAPADTADHSPASGLATAPARAAAADRSAPTSRHSRSTAESSHANGFPHIRVAMGVEAGLERLCVDRQLEEALIHVPDPLRLAEVFSLDEKTAMRYAYSARALLEQPVAQHLR